MKKIICLTIFLILCDLITMYCYITIDTTPIEHVVAKQARVKKMYCQPKEKNNFDKDKYVYLSYYQRVEEVEDIFEEKFSTKEEYLSALENRKSYIDNYENIELKEDENSLTLTTIQSSEVDNYVSLSQMLEYLSKYNCEFIEYY